MSDMQQSAFRCLMNEKNVRVQNSSKYNSLVKISVVIILRLFTEWWSLNDWIKKYVLLSPVQNFTFWRKKKQMLHMRLLCD